MKASSPIKNKSNKLKRLGFGHRDKVLPITGGVLEEHSDGITFFGKDQLKVFFPGVRFSTGMVAPNAAYQMGGTIYISKRWAHHGFDLKAFAHEYGHYLQQREWGTWYYLFKIAIPSLYSAWFASAQHHRKWYERDATARGCKLLIKANLH